MKSGSDFLKKSEPDYFYLKYFLSARDLSDVFKSCCQYKFIVDKNRELFM